MGRMDGKVALVTGAASGIGPVSRRIRSPAFLFILAVFLTGCAGRGSVLPGAAEMPAQPAMPQIVDENGMLKPQQAQAVLDEFRRLAPTDFLNHHLARVEGAVAAPLVLGNDARLLVDGPQTHTAMLEAISAARDSAAE